LRNTSSLKIIADLKKWRQDLSYPIASEMTYFKQRDNFNMSLIRLSHRSVLSLLLIASAFSAVTCRSQEHWVGTWGAAPLSTKNDSGQFGANDSTYREIVHVTLGGNRIRIVLSNEFGDDPLTIGAAAAALSTGKGDINSATSHGLTFGGQPSIVIPPEAMAVSDPIDFKLPSQTDLSVSIFVPAQNMHSVTSHAVANQTNYVVRGNRIESLHLESPEEIYSWPFLKGVEVEAGPKTVAVVAFGDSITDGSHSTRDANLRWPDVLAKRLCTNKRTANLSVLNEAIAGNRILHNRSGQSALARFNRDVLSQPNVRYLIILEGINDIQRTTAPDGADDPVTVAQVTQAYAQMIDRAHAHRLKVIGATLTPYGGARYHSPAGEEMRRAINQWIRTSGKFDAVIDFDKTFQDPANPTAMRPEAGSEDHLHPGDPGYRLMGNSIDLDIFKK
jgi:lysophospholipase L1-like esterase